VRIVVRPKTQSTNQPQSLRSSTQSGYLQHPPYSSGNLRVNSLPWPPWIRIVQKQWQKGHNSQWHRRVGSRIIFWFVFRRIDWISRLVFAFSGGPEYIHRFNVYMVTLFNGQVILFTFLVWNHWCHLIGRRPKCGPEDASQGNCSAEPRKGFRTALIESRHHHYSPFIYY
jgi:hypothetical protein